MIDDIFDILSRRSGVSSSITRIALPLVSRYMLRKIEPKLASRFMSILPFNITNLFSNDEKKQYTTTQEDVSEKEIIERISAECCDGDQEKGKRVYQEAVKILKENNRERQKDFEINN